jgi:voltage-gated potassium channel
MDKVSEQTPRSWQLRLREIIFEADTRAGKAFDVGLLICIVLSVLTVMLESVTSFHQEYGEALRITEWVFTGLFTIEYVLRLLTFGHRRGYAVSFFGVVDLLAILPTYLSLFVGGAQSLVVIRSLRLLRIFRVLKLVQFLGEARMLQAALKASSRKIVVFLGAVMILVLIVGSFMYLIEGTENGFDSIPISIYWAIVTLTTVGYGDIAPHTVMGRVLASLVMITGYGIIAVPTGIVTSELASLWRATASTRMCGECAEEGHDLDARFCKHCGCALPDRRQPRTVSGPYRGARRREGDR